MISSRSADDMQQRRAGRSWRPTRTLRSAGRAASGLDFRSCCGCREQTFDVVICEAVDRLGRRLADTADLQDQLAFHGVRLFTPALGELTPIHVAVMGMMAQMALKDLGEKTKRGQLGRVSEGPCCRRVGLRIPSGPGQRSGGARQIEPDEAEIVRAHLPRVRGRQEPRGDREGSQPRGRPGSGRSTVVQHDHPRASPIAGPGILNNSSLSRRAGVEPVLLCQRPAHRQARRASQSARTMGGPARPGSAHHR